MDRISAFMDGETSHTESRQTVLRLKENKDCCETWETFHLIGDVMRGDAGLRGDFAARFHERMEHEPLLLPPRMNWKKSTQIALSAAASLAAVAVVLTLAFTDNPLRSQAQFAEAPRPAAVDATRMAASPRPVPAMNQARVNEYLMAHQEFSPSSMLQGVAPYVRTVSETQGGVGQ